MDERLLTTVCGCNEGDHILQLYFSSHTLLEVVGVTQLHTVFVGGIVDDGVPLGRGDLPVIDPQCHAAFLSQMPQDRKFLCGDRIAFQRKDATVCSTKDIVVCVEADGGGCDHVEEVLEWRGRRGPCHGFAFLLLRFLI